MDRIKTIICILIIIFTSNISAEQSDDFKNQFENYKLNYNFYSIPDTFYTIQTEFDLPTGFSHVEPTFDSSYKSWISNFPLWHQYKSVGYWKGGKLFEYDQVSRVVHLPWRGPAFKDFAIPVRLFGEYHFQYNTRKSFQVRAKGSEFLTYNKWLNGKAVLNQRSEVFFKEDIAKEDTETEYYKFLLFCMQNVTYKSIANGCDTIAENNIQAGDMFIASDDSGRKGKLIVVLHLISNDSGDIMCLIAHGESDACDFYVPRINENRDMPWLNIQQIKELAGEYNNKGFYRFTSIEINNNK